MTAPAAEPTDLIPPSLSGVLLPEEEGGMSHE